MFIGELKMKIDLEKLFNISLQYIEQYFEKQKTELEDIVAQRGSLNPQLDYPNRHSLSRRHEHAVLYNTRLLVNFLENAVELKPSLIKNCKEVFEKLEKNCISYAQENNTEEINHLESRLAERGLSRSSIGNDERHKLKEKHDERVIDVFWQLIKLRQEEFMTA
jgi:predicted ABC-class ATPase